MTGSGDDDRHRGSRYYRRKLCGSDADHIRRGGRAAPDGLAVGYNGICTHMGAIAGPPAFGAINDATGSYTGGWLMTAGVVAVGVLLLGFGFRPGGRG